VTTDLLTIEPVEAAASAGAVAVAGHMVDRPVLERARRILSRVESTEQSGQS
jgi:citrate lyase beta subunit